MRHRTFAVAAVSITVLAVAVGSVAVQADWHLERIDGGKSFSHMTSRSLALDSAGLPHMAYGRDALYYAHHDGDAWELCTVDEARGCGLSASIAIDGHDCPHVAYLQMTATMSSLRYARHDGTEWRIETVLAGEALTYLGCTLALDEDDKPHVALWDCKEGKIRYATHDGSTWLLETIDTIAEPNVATDFLVPSIAVEKGGTVHVAYYDLTEEALCHARRDAPLSWSVETVDRGEWVGTHCSLAVDALGQPRIAYVDDVDRALKYASSAPGAGWAVGAVPGMSGSSLNSVSLALDEAGVPHILCDGDADAAVRYCTYREGGWTIESIDSDAGWGAFASIALDADQRVHASFVAPGADLRYARRSGAAWSVETVDIGGFAGEENSLAVDAFDRPHVVYSAAAGGAEYRYATQLANGSWQVAVMELPDEAPSFASVSIALTPQDAPSVLLPNNETQAVPLGVFEDGTWSFEAIPDGEVSFGNCALVFDAQGIPHCLYPGAYEQQVTYARRDGAVWRTQAVGEGSLRGADRGLALDSSGRPHVAFLGTFGEDRPLLYARLQGTRWVQQTVDTAPCWGGAIAVDALGRPHIAYMRTETDEICYATHDGASWRTEVIASAESDEIAIAVDASGVVHIAYGSYGEPASLAYATPCDSGWQVEWVDPQTTVYSGISLALDSAGAPAITYFDAVAGDLWIARKPVRATP